MFQLMVNLEQLKMFKYFKLFKLWIVKNIRESKIFIFDFLKGVFASYEYAKYEDEFPSPLGNA